ncbi:hypothetical protein FB645_006021 [Coemansia sp. IMI 203386]|nr:hypothetical protein FB645_006021 [Coemansia sp. IMI 203386]
MEQYIHTFLKFGKSREKRYKELVAPNPSQDTDSNSNNFSYLRIHNEAVLRRIILHISQGDYAHLPNISDIKVLFNNPQFGAILHKAYRTLQLSQITIDEVTARVISVILLSRQCRCRFLKLCSCAFTEPGRKVLFSALSMMADLPALQRKRKSSSTGSLLTTMRDAHCYAPNTAYSEEQDRERETSKHSLSQPNFEDLARNASLADNDGNAPSGLYSLELVRIGMTDEQCSGLSDILCVQPYLRCLRLCSNRIGPNGIRKLAMALSSSCPLLTTLDLSDNRMLSAGAETLAQYLVVAGQQIENLDISSNEIAHAGADRIVHVLGSEYQLGIKHLNLDMNQLEIHGCEALGRALARNNTLVTLKCSRNNIFDQGCGRLFAELGRNRTLRYLDVSGNFITHVGAEAIGRYLLYAEQHAVKSAAANNGLETGLLTLDISGNSLQDEGIDSICRGLQRNRHLLHLVANNIEVSDEGASNIGRLLRYKSKMATSLLTISLRANRHITQTGYRALVTGCKKNQHILRLLVDLAFEGWGSIWRDTEKTFIYNTLRAMDRYRVPLLIVARGRLLLRNKADATGVFRLPMDIRRLIVYELDRFRVLRPDQKKRVMDIASSRDCHYGWTKMQFLAHVLGNDFSFVVHIMETVRS